MNVKKTAVIVCVSAAMIFGAITLSMRLTEARELEMEVCNPAQEVIAQEQTKIYSNGEIIPLYYDDEDILFLPVRNVAQGLGGTVTWEKESKNVIISNKGKKLIIEAGSTTAKMHGYKITMGAETQTVNGCLYVEASILSDFFSTEVQWDSEKRQISLKSKGNSIPIIATDLLQGKNDTKEYTLEVPVIIDLNDTSFEKRLNEEIKTEMQALVDEFMLEEGENTLYLQLEEGFISSDFLSLCSKGLKGEKTFYKTLNIDLREQKKINILEALTEEGIKALNERGEFTENPPFYITKRKELAMFDTTSEEVISILLPVDGALLGEQWKPKYQALFVGAM